MKSLVLFVSTVLAANAAPFISFQPTVYSSLPLWSPVPAVSQYHSQDALGQYSYGYSGGPSAKNEVKTLDGVTRGSYSYIDSNAQLQTVNYVADSLGFRVAATNLPQQVVDTNAAPVDNAQPPKQVEDTPEVQQARAEHLAAVAKARSESSGIELEAPEPVEDTEEVKQAREEHLQAVEEAKARNAQAPSESVEILSQPQLIQVPAAVHLTHAPIAYINAQPATGFAYTVLAPGHHHLSQVIAA